MAIAKGLRDPKPLNAADTLCPHPPRVHLACMKPLLLGSILSCFSPTFSFCFVSSLPLPACDCWEFPEISFFSFVVRLGGLSHIHARLHICSLITSNRIYMAQIWECQLHVSNRLASICAWMRHRLFPELCVFLPGLVLQLFLVSMIALQSPRAGLRLGVNLKLLSLPSLFTFSIKSLSIPAISLHPHCKAFKLSSPLPWTNANAFPASLPYVHLFSLPHQADYASRRGLCYGECPSANASPFSLHACQAHPSDFSSNIASSRKSFLICSLF